MTNPKLLNDSLSPEANDVLRAYAKSRCQALWDNVNDPPCYPSDSDWQGCSDCVDRQSVAAALREATDLIISETFPPCSNFDEYAKGFLDAHVKYRLQLIGIADELVNKTNSPPMTSASLLYLSGKYPDVLKNPAKYLGSNATKVLEFWKLIATFSVQERDKMDEQYYDITYDVKNPARITAIDAADEVVGEEFRRATWDAAYNVTGCGVFGWATLELIGDIKTKVAHDLIMSHKKS